LGWLNTYLPLVVPNFFGGAFNIFLIRQFIARIPTDLDDAWNLVMVASLLLTGPMILVFFIGQRYVFEANISGGSVGIK